MIKDKFLDKLGANTSNMHLTGLNKLIQIKHEHNLVDIWRKKNPYKRISTYHNHDKTIHSRLDRIYNTKTIQIRTCNIIPMPLSDHDGVSAIIQISDGNRWGPGTWKLNTSILKQNEFQEIFKNVWKNWQNKKREYKNHNLWWDAGKLYFKKIAIEDCTRKNRQINNKQQKLTQYISQEKLEKINKYPQELNDIENYKHEGTIISKEKIILNEEKSTKYFYLQKKQKQKKKEYSPTNRWQKNNIWLKNTEILKKCKKYYQQLYNKQKTCQMTQKEWLKPVTHKISNIQNKSPKKQTELSEIQQALQETKNRKSPRIDGIPTEFYKEF